MVMVWPANETMRKLIKHPIHGKFRQNSSDGADWQHDQFTQRRIDDGDVLLHEPTAREERQAEAAQTVPATGLTRRDMASMSRTQLMEEAERVGLSLSSSASKADIIAALAGGE